MLNTSKRNQLSEFYTAASCGLAIGTPVPLLWIISSRIPQGDTLTVRRARVCANKFTADDVVRVVLNEAIFIVLFRLLPKVSVPEIISGKPKKLAFRL